MEISKETDMAMELSDMEIVPPADDASEISDLVADEKDEFYHGDDQNDKHDIDSVAEENDEFDHVDEENDEADIDLVVEEDDELENVDNQNDESDIVAEEKDDSDIIDYQYDEIYLNPIEDSEDLEKILDNQNTGCCDIVLENSIKRVNISEEVIERILCKADKELFTCETTDFLEKASGFNLCMASNSEISLVKNEIVADEEKTAASTDVDTSAETTCDSAEGNSSTTESYVSTSLAEIDEKSIAASLQLLAQISALMVEEEDEDDNEGFECRLASNSLLKKEKTKNNEIVFRIKRTSRLSKFFSKISSKKARSPNVAPREESAEEARSVGDEELSKLGSPEVVHC